MRLLIGIFMLLPLLALAQYPNVQLDSGPALPRGLCEPSISINPTDPANVVVGTILDQVFYSRDSGRTWQRDTLRSSYGVWGDPVVITDQKGHHYYFHLSDPTGRNWKSDSILDRIVVQKSVDGGATWSDGSYMGLNYPKAQDKEWAVVDPQSGFIYATWTQFDEYGSEDPADKSHIQFSRSRDGGESWSPAISINELPGDCLDGDSTVEGAVPAVGPEGNVYLSWGNRGKIFFNRSLDSGRSWMPRDTVVAKQPGGWSIDIPGLNRSNGMPVTVADVSDGPHRGTVYVNWVDKRRGNYDVWISKSSDGGDTWSEPLRINDDTTTADQFLTWITCDPLTGHLYTVFYDRRHYDDTRTDVYLATSTDGGETWENERISASPFQPNEAIFFGDYNNIDAYNGMVRPVWTRYEKGKLSVWTALINK